MIRAYRYVGPEEIRARTAGSPGGREITRPADVLSWAADAGQAVGRDRHLAATFVIDPTERLLVADRHSEHVACAGGREVLAAGEIFFRIEGGTAQVEEVTNQSTGYCPEPESWEVVQRVLDRIGLDHPQEFTGVCVFRLCTSCGARNIVKDGWFHCGVCGRELPSEWNFAQE